MRSALYRGALFHSRRDDWAQRRFEYPVYVASIDLEELPLLHRRLRLFSHNRPNLFSLYDRDYQDAAGAGLTAAARAQFARAGAPAPHTIRLVTNLRVAGYVFNPVSFFLGYDARGALGAVIAEVNNTYGGSRRYLLGPAQRLRGGAGAPTVFRHTRELFVSPFLHGPASYDFAFDVPPDGDALAIRMDVHAGDAADGPRVFVARLTGARRELDDRALAAAALRYPLMTAQVIGLIHYQALRLRLLGVPYRRPGPDHRPLPSVPRGGDGAR
ncbi:MAG: DUF1365 domain-containing protein [Kofleriaceae bacterium]